MISTASDGDKGRALVRKLSLNELRALQKEVAARIGEIERTMRQEALEELERRAEELGLSRKDLRSHFGRGKARRNTDERGTVKYRHPDTGETWAGTGRKPGWVKAYEAEGGRLDDLAVRAAPAGSAP